jgi:hypothetical protein
MMFTSEKATQKSFTRLRLSVHQESFLWALCQELVLSTTQRFVAINQRCRLALLGDLGEQTPRSRRHGLD